MIVVVMEVVMIVVVKVAVVVIVVEVVSVVVIGRRATRRVGYRHLPPLALLLALVQV